MFYEFPRIEFMSDVLPAIEGRDEFIVARRDWGHVINYMVSMGDTFPDPNTAPDQATYRLWAIRRECRGIIFNNERRIISRPLHKFHNIGERDETQIHVVNFDRPHRILEKLDGSFVRPIDMGNGQWVLGTKMGDTDVSKLVQAVIIQRPAYMEFCVNMIRQQLTPVFEFCSRKQKIVVDYPNDRLVLLAVRDNITGQYLDLNEFRHLDLEIVDERQGTVDNLMHLVETTRDLVGQEGWVLRFDSGHMAKIKADDYVRKHSARDSLSQEKNVIDMILNNATDDVKAFLPDEERDRLQKYEDDFWHGVTESCTKFQSFFDTVMIGQCNGERKRFALEVVPTLKDEWTAGIMFSMIDGKPVRDMIVDRIAKSLGTQTKVDRARPLWNNTAYWNYNWDGDA
jgi:RNA ligase